MNSRSICETEALVDVDGFVWRLPVLSGWYPYFKWLYQLIFRQVLSWFSVKGYFWRKSIFAWRSPLFLHSPWHFSLYTVNSAALMAARSREIWQRATSSASVSVFFMDPLQPSCSYPVGFVEGSLLPPWSLWVTRPLMHTVVLATELFYSSKRLTWS